MPKKNTSTHTAQPLQPSPKESQNIQTLSPTELSGAEALQIVQYLNSKQLLCQKCGLELVSQENMRGRYCTKCSDFSRETLFNVKVFAYDEFFFNLFRGWYTSCVTGQRNRENVGDPADNKSSTAAQESDTGNVG